MTLRYRVGKIMNNKTKGAVAIVIFIVTAANFTGVFDGSFHWRRYIPKSFISVSIPYEAVEYNGHHYHVYDDFVQTWSDAEDFCESQGGHLAIIGSDEENNRVYKIMRDSGYKTAYIGLSDEHLTGVWLWTNGESIDYAHWMSDYTPAPVPGYQYALYLSDKEGRWGVDTFRRTSPDDKIAFICEWDE